MGKLLGGLGLCLVLGSAQQTVAQDPFTIPTYEPSREEVAPQFLKVPPPQSEPEMPIIQSVPMAQKEMGYTEKPLKSRPQNAQVRSPRTPAQEYIHQRAVFHAQQRVLRMEHRKSQGQSLLRPGNHPDHSWWYDYSVPGSLPTHTR